MLSVENLKIEFGAKPLFAGVSFVINRKERAALVGKNGAGKSTLLKMLAGEIAPSDGTINIQRDITIGYLPQVMKLSDETSVIEETKKAFQDVHKLKSKVAKLNEELASRSDYESQSYMELVELFTSESERLQLMENDNYEAQIERTLKGLGFKQEEFHRPTKELSGGWRMRIELAKILLQRPDVLLLDEPTNHLDIESIRWLEDFLKKSNAAVILVSHDRAFLNNVTNRTMELTCGQMADYKVPYDEFVKLRLERREQQLRAYENQQKEIASIKDFIERFRYKPTKAIQVQSRIKQLEKIVPIEIDEIDNSALHLKFPPCSRSGDYPVICNDVAKSYGNHCVFSNVNLTIERGQKVAFVGRNGEGKSTLVKCIMNEINHDGILKIGHNVEIGYYAQNQAQLLDENLTVFDTIDHVATGDIRLKIRDILGAFMFGGEASEKKVKVLSGGERSRLAMIELLLQPVNFLILDEPTNHLDMRTKDVLKEALLAFDGTVIVVSHDRDFLNGLVEKVYEFGGGAVREHIGGIYDFLKKKDIERLDELNAINYNPIENDERQKKETPQSEGKLSYEQQKEYSKFIRKAEKLVKEKEDEITALESELEDIQNQIANGITNDSIFIQHAEIEKKLEFVMQEWEKAVQEFDKLSANRSNS